MPDKVLQPGVQVEGAFETVVVEDFEEAFVLLNAVVITEGEVFLKSHCVPP